jgi:hypothetical protein
VTAKPESDFPTIKDLRDCLNTLVDQGLGELPVQIVVMPDTTIQALAKAQMWDGKPTTMIEYSRDGKELGVMFISTDRLAGTALSTETH